MSASDAPRVVTHARSIIRTQWLISNRRFWHVAAPMLIFLGTLVLYLTTLTQVHTFDALSYVTSVEHKPWTEVFHPHHLAYGPLGELALLIGQALGFAGGAALPMQIVNAFAGALGVALFFTVVRRMTQRIDLALVATLLLGGAYAYWYYAVEIEVYTVAALFLVVCLDLLTRIIAAPTLMLYALLGLAQGAAMLFHQTNILFCVPVLVVTSYALRDIKSWRVIAGWWLVYAFVLALTVGLPYVFVAWVSNFHSVDDFSTWMLAYERTGWWGGPITADHWGRLATGWTETLAQPGGALLGLLLVGLVVLRARHLARVSRPLLITLIMWLLVYGAFFFWWEADNIEFWIASLPPFTLLFVLVLAGERRWGPSVCIALAVCATMLGVNYDSIAQRGDPRTDLQRRIASALRAHSTPTDLLLIPDGLLELYLPYYDKHDNFLSINQAMFDNAEHWQAACDSMHSQIEAALHAGGTALISDEVLHPPDILLRRHHLTQAQVAQCFAPYRAAFIAVPMPSSTPLYWRLPTAQERIAQNGWRFTSASDGWQATHIRDPHFDNGWSFVPESDPSFVSPLLDLDSSQYRAIEIRLANATTAHDAQLFFASSDGAVSEQHSLRWTLKPTTNSVTYTLDLQPVAGWQSTITRLRIDPVGVGDGSTMRIESVRLVPH